MRNQLLEIILKRQSTKTELLNVKLSQTQQELSETKEENAALRVRIEKLESESSK